tara:strand:+ start:1239 stop:2090 length:852 start_codon:yes stop_codon:yes gene_type:complete
MDEIIFLNGDYINRENAKISIMDRGFLFGDGVYELIPIYKSKPFLIKKHLDRLHSSMSLIGMSDEHFFMQDFENIFNELIERNEYKDHFFYVHVTRGYQSTRNHVYDKKIQPTVLIMGEGYNIFSSEQIKRGFKGCTQEDFRWTKSHIKSISLLGNVLLKNYAAQQNFYETLLLRDAKLTEGSASNIFISKGDDIFTPSLGVDLLPGVTRDLLIELFFAENKVIHECDVTKSDLQQADEIWCTSSTNYCVPITELDGVKVGNGQVGDFSLQAYDLISRYISTI